MFHAFSNTAFISPFCNSVKRACYRWRSELLKCCYERPSERQHCCTVQPRVWCVCRVCFDCLKWLILGLVSLVQWLSLCEWFSVCRVFFSCRTVTCTVAVMCKCIYLQCSTEPGRFLSKDCFSVKKVGGILIVSYGGSSRWILKFLWEKICPMYNSWCNSVLFGEFGSNVMFLFYFCKAYKSCYWLSCGTETVIMVL